MTWGYGYTSYIWPSLLTALLLNALWAAGSGLEISAVDAACIGTEHSKEDRL